MDRATTAAKMMGEWWAKRLHPDHDKKREAFGAAVAARIEQVLRGECDWSWSGKFAGKGAMPKFVRTEVDYDPQGLILEAVCEVVDSQCRGVMFSARGILPEKHELKLDTTTWVLKPKEGYGNWTAEIPVPEPIDGGNR